MAAADDDEGIVLRKCAQCGVMQTHMWRDGPDGKKTLCNSCGLKYKKAQETPLFVMEGPRKRQPSSRLIEEVSAAAAAAATPPPAPPTTRTQVTKKDLAPLPALPKALVQSQLGTRIPISATTGYTFEEKFNMTYKPEPPPSVPDSDAEPEPVVDERERDAVDPPSQYLPTPAPVALSSSSTDSTPTAVETSDGAAPKPAETPAAATAPQTNAEPPVEMSTEPDTQSEILIVVRIELPGPGGQKLQETVVWNLNEQHTTPDDFAMAMCADMHLQEGCRRIIASAITAASERYAPLRLYRETREDVRVIRLAFTVGAVGFKDQFEWDINSTTLAPEAFARSLCVDMGLSREFEVSIAAGIRAQVLEYKLSAIQGRTLGRSAPPAYALRSEKDLPNWTPALHPLKDNQQRRGYPASAMSTTTTPQMLTPESFRPGAGSTPQSTSKNVVYTLRT